MRFGEIFGRNPSAQEMSGRATERRANKDEGIIFEEVDEAQEREGHILALESELRSLETKQDDSTKMRRLETQAKLDQLMYEQAIEKINEGNFLVFEVGDSVKVAGGKESGEWKVAAHDESAGRYTLINEATNGIKHIGHKELVAWQEDAGRDAYARMSSSKKEAMRFNEGRISDARKAAESLAKPAVADYYAPPQSQDSELLRARLGMTPNKESSHGGSVNIQK